MLSKLPIAVQVYSVRDDAAADFKGTLQKLKDMGYDGVELAGLYGMTAAEVRAALDEVGIPRIRFMTSHPKDATQKLFETMAACEKVAPVLHLPFQAGNDRILQVMNRISSAIWILMIRMNQRNLCCLPKERVSCLLKE